MSDFCRKCHEWASASHVCPPAWELRDPERHDLDEWHLGYAMNAEWAAEQFVEQHERRDCEYPVASGGEVTILVREPGAKSAGVGYVVTGESVPTYHARLERPKKEHRTALDVVAESLEREVVAIVQEEAPELLRKVRGETQPPTTVSEARAAAMASASAIGPTLSYKHTPWVEGRDPDRKRILLGGLGVFGVGTMWCDEEEHHKSYLGYVEAPIRSADAPPPVKP